MKRRLWGVLLMLVMVVSMGLTANAASKETYIDEDNNGVPEYCWVRGASTEKPTKMVQGYTWIIVRDGNSHATRLGACDAHGIVDHDCGDIWDKFERMEYQWQLVVKELLVIDSRDQAGYSMVGAEFLLLKQKLECDESGNPLTYVDDAGIVRVTYQNSEVICRATVGSDGYAKMRLEEERLDSEKTFQQLLLAQSLSEEQIDEYSTIQNRWYVNFVMNEDGEYEVYSITEAPPVNVTDYEELKNSNFGKLEEGFVPEYDTGTQVMHLRNSYRVGKIFVNIKVEGFTGEVPVTAKPSVYITGPYNNWRVRDTKTLEEMRMGDYTIKWSDPVNVTGYTQKHPEVTVSVVYPANGETVELSTDANTVNLHRDHANAEINVIYTYYPDHVHTWDDGVVTEPTCTERGYTTYTCTGYDQDGNKCNETKQGDFVTAYGHDYEETTIESTCTEDGIKIYTCTYCGHTYEKAGDPSIGHEYETEVTKPGCEVGGYTTYTCIKCEYSYIGDETDPTGHKFNFTGEQKVTCTEDGKKVFTCEYCGEKKEESVTAASGHSYDKGVVTKPTCEEKGYTTYTCTNKDCGYSYQGEFQVALEHKYKSQVIQPTTEREGYTIHTCSVCGDSYTDDIKDKLSSGKKNNSSSGAAADISGSASDALIVKFYDEYEQPLNSGMVALYEGNTQLKSWSCSYDNVAVVDNLEAYAKDGAVAAYTLKQSKAMSGYEASADTFTVQLQMQSGNLKVNVTKNGKSSKGSSVENGRDGKPIVTFYNEKETTQFDITCQVSVDFEENCLPDEAMVKEYLKKEYQFTLSWLDEAGTQKTESISLINGGSGTFKAKIPFGTDYEITAIDADGKTVTGLSENASGTLTAKQMESKVKVDAEIKYMVQPASPKQLEMNVVDSENAAPLRGANFELKDPDGEKIATYISRENGQFYIEEDTFLVLGDYLMNQTKAAEEYAPLSGGVPVTVSLAYEPESENNVQLLNQYKAVTFAHQAVSEEEDGSFTIENDTYDLVVEKVEKKGGKTGIILGIAGGALALGAGAAAFMVLKKKRSKADAEAINDAETINDAKGGDDDEE